METYTSFFGKNYAICKIKKKFKLGYRETTTDKFFCNNCNDYNKQEDKIV